MQTQPTETQTLLRNSLRQVLEREAPFARLRELERTGESDSHLWETLRQDGWLALPFPSEVGGADGSLVDVAIVVEELARRAVIVPYMETVASLLVWAGDGYGLLSDVLNGRATVVPALFDENDTASGDSCVVDPWGRLTGHKQAVDFPDSSFHLVSTGGRLALVSAHDVGVQIDKQPHIGRTPKGWVRYEGVAAQLVADGDGLDTLLRIGTALAAAQCLGLASTALEMTLSYVAHRVQFGRPIGTFQAVQHECADMATMLEITRFLVYEAVGKLQSGTARAEDVAVAKRWASKTAVEVTLMAHQLHGGVGVTEEYDLNFFSRRAKERALAWATETECTRAVAESVDVEEAWV